MDLFGILIKRQNLDSRKFLETLFFFIYQYYIFLLFYMSERNISLLNIFQSQSMFFGSNECTGNGFITVAVPFLSTAKPIHPIIFCADAAYSWF